MSGFLQCLSNQVYSRLPSRNIWSTGYYFFFSSSFFSPFLVDSPRLEQEPLAMAREVGPFESVSPLPASIRGCLIAMAGMGVTSLVASSLLWLHITYRLILWKIRDIRFQKMQLEPPAAQQTNAPRAIDLNLGLAENHYYQTRYNNSKNATDMPSSLGQKPPEQTDTVVSQVVDHGQSSRQTSTRREKPPNPLLLLIYNLILADVVLSLAYMNNISWLRMDGIIAKTSTCFAQGWTVSFGCLTTSAFLFAISIFSYAGIIRGYKAKSRDVGIACSIVWILSLLLASLGPMVVHDGTFYGRETNWVSLCLLHVQLSLFWFAKVACNHIVLDKRGEETVATFHLPHWFPRHDWNLLHIQSHLLSSVERRPLFALHAPAPSEPVDDGLSREWPRCLFGRQQPP